MYFSDLGNNLIHWGFEPNDGETNTEAVDRLIQNASRQDEVVFLLCAILETLQGAACKDKIDWFKKQLEMKEIFEFQQELKAEFDKWMHAEMDKLEARHGPCPQIVKEQIFKLTWKDCRNSVLNPFGGCDEIHKYEAYRRLHTPVCKKGTKTRKAYDAWKKKRIGKKIIK